MRLPSLCRYRIRGWTAVLVLLLVAIAGPAPGSQASRENLPEGSVAASTSTGSEFPAKESVEEAHPNSFLPLPVIFYTPETKLALGFSAIYIYRPADADVESRPSLFGGVAIYTLNNQVLAGFGGEHYWDHDRQQFKGGVFYRNFPNDFYGLGNDTDAELFEDYSDEAGSFSADYLRTVAGRIRIGGGVGYGTSSITRTEPGDCLSGDLIPGADGGQYLGAGLKATYDSRGNIVYPLASGFHQLSWWVYGKALGADFSFNTTTVDLRQYLHLGGSRVLALRGLGIFGGGNMPFQMMPALGGDNLLRGYFQGRFRERKLLALQGEFRSRVWSRIGAAVFGGLGQVARETGQLGLNRFHHSYGVGLRILLVEKEGMNLRTDFGFGSDQSGFYLGIGEVF